MRPIRWPHRLSVHSWLYSVIYCFKHWLITALYEHPSPPSPQGSSTLKWQWHWAQLLPETVLRWQWHWVLFLQKKLFSCSSAIEFMNYKWHIQWYLKNVKSININPAPSMYPCGSSGLFVLKKYMYYLHIHATSKFLFRSVPTQILPELGWRFFLQRRFFIVQMMDDEY